MEALQMISRTKGILKSVNNKISGSIKVWQKKQTVSHPLFLEVYLNTIHQASQVGR